MNDQLVSIALCTYNGEKYLTEQLDTLINQTYSNIEIIVVDDCSTDHTYTILTGYSARYPQLKIHQNNKNLGFSANFEKAVTLCKGELIALCDQDDLWHPRKIELQVNTIKDNIFIYHDSEFISQDGSSMNKNMSDLMNLYRGNDPEAFLFFNCVSGHSILMRKELLVQALPLPKNYFHDWWLAYVATNIGTIDFIPEPLVKYRQHEKSETNILQLLRDKDDYKFSSRYKIQRTYKWLGYCAAFTKNKNAELIMEIYKAYEKKINNYITFDLSFILYKYRHIIFFIRKKNNLSRFNFIYGQIWGSKLK